MRSEQILSIGMGQSLMKGAACGSIQAFDSTLLRVCNSAPTILVKIASCDVDGRRRVMECLPAARLAMAGATARHLRPGVELAGPWPRQVIPIHQFMCCSKGKILRYKCQKRWKDAIFMSVFLSVCPAFLSLLKRIPPLPSFYCIAPYSQLNDVFHNLSLVIVLQ